MSDAAPRMALMRLLLSPASVRLLSVLRLYFESFASGKWL